MAVVTGIGTTWNLPNFAGELFTADATSTPLLTIIGGMTGGRMTNNREFTTGQLFDYPAAEQPSISEQASATAPQARHIDRNQTKNVVQIHQDTVDLTYHKMANSGRMSGLNTAGQQPSPTEELAWQITHSLLVPAARNIEYSFIRGQYALSGAVNQPSKTRGMLELCSDPDHGVEVDGAAAPLSYEMLQDLYVKMADNGAYFADMVMFVPAKLKQMASDIYASRPGATLPATRTEAGINVTNILTDFTSMRVIWNRFMPEDSLLIADVRYMAPVFMEVPGKGVMFVEPLAKVGASERRMLYGEVGLDHGPAFLHGAIKNIG